MVQIQNALQFYICQRMQDNFNWRNLRVELQAGQSSNAGEVETEIDGWHREESALAVHYPVVVAQSEGTGASEGVTGDQGDCWVCVG